jgi:alpha-amylase/alpha-mannosidase (GH57 family)
MPNTTLHVAFLWHMHQPSYRLPEEGDIIMPWVRLHAARDYTDMATVMATTPNARATVNWVPGLLDQCSALADPAQARRDRFWRLTAADPATLDANDIAFIRDRFFSLPHTTLLEPRPRYRELRDRVRAGLELSTQELLDLQVWFNLAWCGLTLQAMPELAPIVAQGRDFTPAQKLAVLEAQRQAAVALEARWLALGRSGQVEISLSPYYHPIVPLLVDTHAARDSDPATPLPRARFRHPDDARAHVHRAIDPAQRRHFRDAAGPLEVVGMWPSEGSISPAALPLFRDAGVRWLATDEILLHRSLAAAGASDPMAHFRPWRSAEATEVTLFFRDHGLSDRIGFVYANWRAEAAHRDFVDHLQRIRAALAARGRTSGVVVVALDGENCWEHYQGGILGFLPGLYDAIAASDGLVLSTLSEARAAFANDTHTLPALHPGSWIDGTFRTWIGDPVKNRAWDQLVAAREAVAAPIDEVRARDPQLAELVMRAEASDWWWWFGEGHSTAYDGDFDALFRAHLRAIWHRLGRPHPPALDRSLYTTDNADRLVNGPPAAASTQPAQKGPDALLTVDTDGRDDWYYKWLGAGEVRPSFGAIHRFDAAIRGLRYANDTTALYLRLETDPVEAFRARFGAEARVVLVVVRTDGSESAIELGDRSRVRNDLPHALSAHCDVFEATVPAVLVRDGIHGHQIDAWIRIEQPLGADDWAQVERFPSDGFMHLRLLTPADAAFRRRI